MGRVMSARREPAATKARLNVVSGDGIWAVVVGRMTPQEGMRIESGTVGKVAPKTFQLIWPSGTIVRRDCAAIGTVRAASYGWRGDTRARYALATQEIDTPVPCQGRSVVRQRSMGFSDTFLLDGRPVGSIEEIARELVLDDPEKCATCGRKGFRPVWVGDSVRCAWGDRKGPDTRVVESIRMALLPDREEAFVGACARCAQMSAVGAKIRGGGAEVVLLDAWDRIQEIVPVRREETEHVA